MQSKSLLMRSYGFVTGDKNISVNNDVPTEAHAHIPRNFFAYLLANIFTKIADELTSARIIMPWLLGSLGSSSILVGFIVPMREAGVLLPQLWVSQVIQNMAVRKWAWIFGAVVSALALGLLAIVTALEYQGFASLIILIAFLLYSLARGICSVTAKDVLGKTVAKSRRGTLMGFSASISSVFVLALGLFLLVESPQTSAKLGQVAVFVVFFTVAASLWLVAALLFNAIKEPKSTVKKSTPGLLAALQSVAIVKSDKVFRHYLIGRTLLLSLALMPPFLVLSVQRQAETGNMLGHFIIANGLAGILSGVIWGKLSDYSSRLTMVMASFIAAAAGLSFWLMATFGTQLSENWGLSLLFFIVCVSHAGARLGRKTYLVDMANDDNRASYVAVGNTLIGVLMLFSGGVGLIAECYSAQLTVLFLALLALVCAFYTMTMKDVSL